MILGVGIVHRTPGAETDGQLSSTLTLGLLRLARHTSNKHVTIGLRMGTGSRADVWRGSEGRKGICRATRTVRGRALRGARQVTPSAATMRSELSVARPLRLLPRKLMLTKERPHLPRRVDAVAPCTDDVQISCSILFPWNTHSTARIVAKEFRWCSICRFGGKPTSKTAKCAANLSRLATT